MNEDDRVELVACPFCGSGDIGRHYCGSIFIVECQSCGAQMIKSDEAAALEQWNTRAPLQGADTVTEAMIEAGGLAYNGRPHGTVREKLPAIYAAMRAAAPTAQDDTGARLDEGPVQDDDALIDKLSDLCRRIQGCWQSPTGQPPPRRAKSFTPEWKDASTLLDAMIFIERNRSSSRLSADHTGVLVEALEAIKEFADAGETQLCWETANDALATVRGEQSPDVEGGGR